MSARFEELDWRATPLGELVLRRRWDPIVDREVHEIKLNDEFLMSSLFTVAEVELGRLALAELTGSAAGRGGGRARARLHRAGRAGEPGRGLAGRGRRARRGDRVARAGVDPRGRAADRRPPVRPGARRLLRDGAVRPRSRPAAAGRLLDAVVVDIDHSPRHLLHPATPTSTSRRACGGSPRGCTPAACSRSGPTTRPTTSTPPRWPRSSPGQGRHRHLRQSVAAPRIDRHRLRRHDGRLAELTLTRWQAAGRRTRTPCCRR